MATQDAVRELVRVAPSTGPVAPAVWVAATLLAAAALLLNALFRWRSGPTAERLRALAEVDQIVSSILSHPTMDEGIAAQGLERLDLLRRFAGDIEARRSELLLPGELPRFDTLAEAQEWFGAFALGEAQGWLSSSHAATVQRHWTQEARRLGLGVTVRGVEAVSDILEWVATLPVFADLEAANAWLGQAQLWWRQGYLTNDALERLSLHYTDQVARLMDLVAVPSPTRDPLILQFVESRPTFVLVEQAQSRLITASAYLVEGRITEQEFAAIQAHVQAEIARLSSPLVGPAAPELPWIPVPPPAVPASDLQPVLAAIAQLQSALATLQAQPGVSQAQLGAISTQIAAMTAVAERPFPTTFESPGLQSSIFGLNGILSGVGVGSLSGSMASAMTASAGPMGHNSQLARYGCMSSFATPLLDVARRLMPGILGASALFFDTPLRGFLEDRIDGLFDAQLALERFGGPVTEADALPNARDRLLEAIRFAVQAQLISYSAEAMTPLKQMGFNQMAGFLGEVAGFDRIAFGVMGAVEQAAVVAPMRWRANRRFRPTIPAEQTVELMFAKSSLTFEELRDYMERLGLDDRVIGRMPEYMYRDPRLGELVRAFQFAEPDITELPPEQRDYAARIGLDLTKDDWYYRYKLAKAGYEPADVQGLAKALRMGLVRREQTLWYQQITRLYREGFIEEDRARDEIRDAREPSDVTTFRLNALRLYREYELKNDLRGLLESAQRKGLITVDEGVQQFQALGMDPVRARINLLRARMGLLRGEFTVPGVSGSALVGADVGVEELE